MKYSITVTYYDHNTNKYVDTKFKGKNREDAEARLHRWEKTNPHKEVVTVNYR